MAFPQKRWFVIPKKVAHVKAVLLKHNSWEFHCGHIFPNGIFYCKKRHFPGPLVLLHLHRGWVKNFVVKVTLFLLALVNVWNFTQATLRGDDRMMNVFGRDKLLSNYWVWKLPLFQAVFFCSWKFTAKLKKSTTPLGGPMLRCCRAVVFQSFYSEVWFYHPTHTHAHCCVFPTESIFTLNELVSYACGLRKFQLLNDLKSPPLQSCAWLARSSDGRNSFWSHLAWWCAHQGSLEVV